MITGASELLRNFTSGDGYPIVASITFGILREVQRVRLVLDILVASVEDGVVERGRELRHAAAHVRGMTLAHDLSADDRAVLEVALRRMCAARRSR
jgi:hypothetical protein